LVEGGKYFNKCLFSSVYPPGTHYLYVNLNFGIAGAIVEKVSGIRFDIFLR
jgi:CubicO group peptidase (beta-lactamase class C family)